MKMNVLLLLYKLTTELSGSAYDIFIDLIT